MKVNLTSNFTTFYWKIFWPIFISLGLSLSLVFPLPKNEPKEDVQFVIAFIFFIVFILYNSTRLKFVKGDNDYLYVRNYFKKVKIPLENMLQVTESRFPSRIIIIELKENSEFGKKITFIPYSKWFLFGLEHPVLKELQSCIDKKNTNEIKL